MQNAKGRVVLALTGLVSMAVTGKAFGAAPPSGAVVRAWNDQALATFRLKSSIDAEAARSLAMLNVAIYDAANGIASGHGSGARDYALVPFTNAPANGDLTAAAATAAHDVLSALYPSETARFDAQLASDLTGLKGTGRVDDGKSWGQSVAAAVLAARANDGSSPTETQPAGAGPGQFRASWSDTQYRNLLPFGIASVSPYLGSTPPALSSPEYAAAWLDVKTVGGAVPADQAKLDTYRFWSLGAGTSQPPGAWIMIASAVTAAGTADVVETARLYALLSMALSDTVAPTYATKYTTHSWRPTTAIREADTDGNDQTTADPTWTSRSGSVGGTPEHWSGHSVFSGAAAEVLAAYFCNDAIPFSFASDSAPSGQARSYPGFAAAAAEAGRSRVYGGVHFEFSNQKALTVGRQIADEILTHKLLKLSGPVRNDTCPTQQAQLAPPQPTRAAVLLHFPKYRRDFFRVW